MRAFTRWNIFAMVIGVLLTGAPLIAFNFWVGGLIERQGDWEVGTSAKRAIGLAEARVKDAVETLDRLAVHGID